MISEKLLTKSRAGLDLESLLSPLPLADFFDQYWERKPLILNREDQEYYRDLFSIEQVDQVLDLHRPTGRYIRVVKNQEPLLPTKYENPDGSLNLNQLYASYVDGYTVVINEIERYWQPLKNLTHQISQYLSHHAVANMYLTPKNQKALLPHYDTHDVFVVQIHGSKHWRIYDATVETPLLNSFQPIFQRDQLQNCKELTVHAGDIMYMPRGIPHEAYTTDESSLHLTIGVHPAQWLDLLTRAFQQLAFAKPELRKALPVGYLNPASWTPEFSDAVQTQFQSILQAAVDEASVQGSIHLLAEEFRGQHAPMGDGHFSQLDQLESLDADVYLEKRQNAPCTIHHLGTAVRIVFPGNMIKGPAHITAALQYIADADGPFQLKDLPSVSEANKTKLAARLIRGGLLKIVEG